MEHYGATVFRTLLRRNRQVTTRLEKRTPKWLLGYKRARANGYSRNYGCFKRTASRLLRKLVILPSICYAVRRHGEALIEMGIEYHRIQIATPRHNGKVERQHRTDELRFYKRMRMYCLEDGRKQLAAYQRRSNDHIMTCLGMRSPNEVLDLYRGIM